MGNNVDLQKLAYVIKVKRQEKGFTTMEQIAEYIGYTRVYLSQILNGKIEITQDVKDKLMYKLNIYFTYCCILATYKYMSAILSVVF